VGGGPTLERQAAALRTLELGAFDDTCIHALSLYATGFLDSSIVFL
jgi:hypothetical protein